MTDRKILISRRDFIQDGNTILSFGNWSAAAPMHNILDPRPSFVAEAGDNLWESTLFFVDFGFVRNMIGLFFFANLKTSSLGLMRIVASVNVDMSSPSYDSGVVSTWPQDVDGGTNNSWGDFTLNGVYTSEEYARLGMNRFFVPPSPIKTRFVTVNIRDSTNPNPVQIGCFGACEVWECPNGFGAAPQITIMDESSVDRVPFGSSYVNKRGLRRRVNFGFPAIDNDEVLSRSLGLALMKGKSQPLVAVCYPDDIKNLERTSVYGMISTDGVLSNPFFGKYAQPIQIDEII